jgi:hypothetical protein
VANAVRTTISIPASLRDRMRPFNDRATWSSIAASAFEAKLLELESQTDPTTDDEAVARLRAADAEDTNRARQEGESAGRAWAMKAARPRQLRRLADHAFDAGAPDWESVVAVASTPRNPGVPAALFLVLNPEKDGVPQEVTGFWETVLGPGGEKRIENAIFAVAFIHGAVQYWTRVRTRVEGA